eukprot:gene1942-1987_t
MKEYLVNVSSFYSEELVAFVRNVLDIIPISIFEVLQHIIHIQVDVLKDCPTKLPRAGLKEAAQLESRFELAHKTAEISKFADGILAIEKFSDKIQVHPQQLLEDGIRKKLVREITLELNKRLVFDPKKRISAEEFDAQMTLLGKRLQGLK